MSVTYVYDNQGNKYVGMTKDEILETIGAGGLRENVFTGSVIYNYEEIPYEYNGDKPTDDMIVKLIDCGFDFENNLSQSEAESLLALKEFKLHIFLCETDLYITNGHCDCINIYNAMLGIKKIYPRTSENNYYIKSSLPMKDLYFCTEQEFSQITKQEDNWYIVTDEEYAVDRALRADSADVASVATQANNATNATNAANANYATRAANADYATSAARATNDKNGNDITTTYSKIDRVKTISPDASNPIFDLNGTSYTIDLKNYLPSDRTSDQIMYVSGKLKVVIKRTYSSTTGEATVYFHAPINAPTNYTAHCDVNVFFSEDSASVNLPLQFDFLIEPSRQAKVRNVVYYHTEPYYSIMFYLQTLSVYYR